MATVIFLYNNVPSTYNTTQQEKRKNKDIKYEHETIKKWPLFFLSPVVVMMMMMKKNSILETRLTNLIEIGKKHTHSNGKQQENCHVAVDVSSTQKLI